MTDFTPGPVTYSIAKAVMEAWRRVQEEVLIKETEVVATVAGEWMARARAEIGVAWPETFHVGLIRVDEDPTLLPGSVAFRRARRD